MRRSCRRLSDKHANPKFIDMYTVVWLVDYCLMAL